MSGQVGLEDLEQRNAFLICKGFLLQYFFFCK
jgi:hypothetical protein